MQCPICGEEMCHDSDFTYEELGYVGDGTVSFYECLNCETMVEVDVPNNSNAKTKRGMNE